MRLLRLMTLAVCVVAIFGLGAHAVSAQQTEDTYIVQPGDTLRIIAQRYNTTVAAIVTRNNITNPDRINVGQVLIIPRLGSGGGSMTPPNVITYVVQPGDSLRSIAARYNTTFQAIATLNNISASSYIYPGQVLRVQPGTVVSPPTTTPPTVIRGYYTVRTGDTLARIARSLNVDMWSIARANGILNLNRIFVGQQLRIPGY